MRTRSVCGLVALLLVAGAAQGKGITTRIAIQDLGQGTSVEITDPELLQAFNVWAGPGTAVNGVPGTEGFIVNWKAGSVAERPRDVRRYEVSFYVRFPRTTDEQLAYVVTYELGPNSDGGFVYLPGRSDPHFPLNTKAILRGVEGKWFRASSEWQAVMRTVLPTR